MAQLNFKYGLSAGLATTPLNEGSILVTTDTHSMFIDLEGKRFRLSDFEIYETVDALLADQKSWYDGCLALIKSNNTNGVTNAPTLAYYDKTSGKWININDTSALSTAITQNAQDIQSINDSIDTINDSITTINASITSINETIEGLVSGEEGESLGTLRAALNQEIENRAKEDAKLLGASGDNVAENTIHAAKNAAAAAKKAAEDAQDTANAALPKAGGEITGTLDVDQLLTASGQITTSRVYGLSAPSGNDDAANKKYVDDAKSTLLGDKDGTSTSNPTIYDVKRAAAAAKKAADDAQGTANNAYDLAGAALPKAGGTITGDLSIDKTLSVTGTLTANGTISTKKVSGLDAPTADTEAANKKYVDDAKSTLLGDKDGTSTAGATIHDVKRAAKAAQDTADAALPKTGGEITGTLKVDGLLTASGTISTTSVTGLNAPSGNTDATNKQYVDGAIATAIATNDAMVFRGTVGKQKDGSGVGDLKKLPTELDEMYSDTEDAWKFKPQKGDTFKVAYAGTIAGISVKVGDLLINAGEDDATPDWKHITSGYEDDYLQKIRVNAGTNTIYLTDGVLDSELDEDQGVVTFKSGVVKTESGSSKIDSTNNNIKIETLGTNICFSLEWGTF